MRITRRIKSFFGRANPKVMTPEASDWEKFTQELEKRLDFRQENGKITWRCNGGWSRPVCTGLLQEMGYDVEASLAYFGEHGGHCDCEVIFNCVN